MAEMWGKIKECIDRWILGSTGAVVFLLIQFLWYRFDKNYSVPMWVVSLMLIGFYIGIVIVYAFCRTRTVNVAYQLPRVRTYEKVAGNIILIVERNDLFSDGSLVTVYRKGSSNELEIPLAVGMVQLTSSEKNVQIQLIKSLDSELITSIFPVNTSTKASMEKIVVKPTISQVHLQEMMSQ